MKTYHEQTTNIYYTIRQKALAEVCAENDLTIFKPNYHGDKGDGGTVFIDRKNGDAVCTVASQSQYGNIEWGVVEIRKTGAGINGLTQIDIRKATGAEDLKNAIRKLI